MKIQVISDLLESLYYAGRVTSDRKLDSRDFEQLVILARGEAIKNEFERSIKMFGMTALEQSGYLQSYAKLETKKVIEKGNGRKYIELDSVLQLANGYGIFHILGASNQGDCPDLFFQRLGLGTSWQIDCNEMEESEVYFEPIGKSVRFYNLPKCVKEIDLLVITESGEDTEISSEVGFTILKMVFQIASLTKQFVVDSLDDYSGSDDQQKSLLAQFQTNDERASKTH